MSRVVRWALARRTPRRSPTILQMEAVECGAACLAMVLAFRGVWVPLEKLRVECGVSRNGAKASNLLRAARRYGMDAKGFKSTPAKLADLPMPCIIHWNFNHFVVLDGLDADYAYLNDPGSGRRRVSREELSESFTGVVLAMEPGASFTRSGRKPPVFAPLLHQLGRMRAAVWMLLAVSAFLVIPGIVIPGLSRLFVDDVLIGGRAEWFTPLLIGLGVTALFRLVVTAFQQSLLLRLETTLGVTMTARFLWHVMSLPMEFFGQRHAGDISDRVAANERIAQLLSGAVAINAINLLSLVFFALAMAAYDGILAAIGIGISLVNVIVLLMVGRVRTELNSGLAMARGKFAGATVGVIRTIETLKAGGMENDAFARWAGLHARVMTSDQKLGAYSAATEVAPAFIGALTTTAILGVGGVRVMDGALTVGGLVAFQSLLLSFQAPILTLVQLAGRFFTVKGDLARLQDVMDYPADTAPSHDALDVISARKLSGRVEVSDLSFGYSPLDPPLIAGFSLKIEPGARVALVGGSGSGKSTIGRLITGLAQPWGGTVRHDGVPIADIPTTVLAASVAYVDQDIFLFQGTARENLTLWDPEIPDARLTRALADAAILDDILARPGTYDCHVDEGGINFSGGQRQRIEIARALLGDPSVLVLDEATSALDPATEKLIDDNLRRRGCTCIIVAHRLSTVRDCDEIIVLDLGRIVERGTHDELVALDGAYAALVAQT